MKKINNKRSIGSISEAKNTEKLKKQGKVK